MSKLRIATRGSKLALWQAEFVRAELVQRDPELVVELVVLKTRGDEILDRPLNAVGGKGLFVKEIEAALLDGGADLAVHSMKDLPSEIPDQLWIAAVPPRATVQAGGVCSGRGRSSVVAACTVGSAGTSAS